MASKVISGQLDRYTCFTFCLLLVLNAQQACSNLVPEGSGTDLIDTCIKNCSNEPISQLCASNAETYDNLCEFDNAKCEDSDMLIVYHEPCVTLPPPPENLCKKHQQRYLDISDADYFKSCDAAAMKKKVADKTLQLMDFNDDCYSPHCVGDNYHPMQCSELLRGWCWCTDSKGIRIEGTLKNGLKLEDCIKRNSCAVKDPENPDKDREFSDGDLFVHESGCGLCECLNGVVSCFEDYIPATSGELNDTQLQQLKDELLQLFYFQYNHKEHVIIDIRHIHQHPTLISASIKKTVLQWKFDYYDRNGNDGLSPGERWLFQQEIDSFIHCSSFFDHIADLMNENNDNLLVLNEWTNFFDVSMQPATSSSNDVVQGVAKRSVPFTSQELRVRRLENRKKFYYTLS